MIAAQKSAVQLTQTDINTSIRLICYYRYYRRTHSILSYRFRPDNLNNNPIAAQQLDEKKKQEREKQLVEREKQVKQREEAFKLKKDEIKRIHKAIREKMAQRDALIAQAEEMQLSLMSALKAAQVKLTKHLQSVKKGHKNGIKNVQKILNYIINDVKIESFEDEKDEKDDKEENDQEDQTQQPQAPTQSFSTIDAVKIDIKRLQKEIDEQKKLEILISFVY